jgi:hypothetical protein
MNQIEATANGDALSSEAAINEEVDNQVVPTVNNNNNNNNNNNDDLVPTAVADVKLTKRRYNIYTYDSVGALSDIASVTNGFTSILSPDYAIQLQMVLYGRPPYPTFVGVLPFTVSPDTSESDHATLLKKVIGGNGQYLKLTTQKSQADFIWYDDKTCTFLVYAGRKIAVIRALNAISWRIKKYKSPVAGATIDE